MQTKELVYRNGLPKSDHRYLAIIRGAEKSEHTKWDPAKCNFDVLCNYYGKSDSYIDPKGASTVAGGVAKYPAIKTLFEDNPVLFESYDFIFLLDDDIEMPEESVNRLFDIARAYQLDLCQASLTHESSHAWKHTLRHPCFRLRYTNFVEIMAPLFSAKGLRKCLSTLDESISGYGLDFAWPKLLDNGKNIAIVDEVVMKHLKGVDMVNGAFYTYLRSIDVDPILEFQNIMRKYALEVHPIMYGGVLVDQNNNVYTP